ncbi:MAG TPA: hypothetical protein VKP78_03420 [bacterium]|nr:hypothetical protein [bacterium]
MKGSVMVSAISLSDKVDKILDQNKDLNSALNALSNLIKEELDCQVSFCELFGKRWSFIAGSDGSYNAKQRIKLSPDYGLIFEKKGLSDQEVKEIEQLSKMIIEYYE